MLNGPRIFLRAIEKNDLPLIARWRSDPNVYDFFYEFEPLSLEQQARWYEKQLGDKTEKNFIVAKLSGEAIGTVSVVHIDYRNRRAEWGRLLLSEESGGRGAGLGVEVELLILEYCFEHLNMNKLYCEVLVTNPQVIKLHKKIGFVEEGLLREHCYKQGKMLDVKVLSMLKSEYDLQLRDGDIRRLKERLWKRNVKSEQ